jgi:DNA-binding NarL/FixJ family response regulator
MPGQDARAGLRILLADDEVLVRDGLAMILNAEPDLRVVCTADDGAEAVRLASSVAPDVVLMDVRMPGMGGVAATQILTADGFGNDPTHTVCVVMLTSFNDTAAVREALRNGASGFLLKSSAPRDVAAAMRSVAAGHAWLDPQVTRGVIEDLVSRPEPALPTSAVLSRLTARERTVLSLLAHGLGTLEIAAHLVISEATARTHIGRILMKLGVRDRAQAVAFAYRSRLVGPDDRPLGPA